MYRVTASLPRLAACAACVSAVLVQRRMRKGAAPQQSDTRCKGEPQQRCVVSRSQSASMASTSPVQAQMSVRLPNISGGLSTALVRSLCQALSTMWLSLAIGAAASWAAVSSSMVSTLKQLKVAPAHQTQTEVLDVSTIKQFCGHWTKVRESSESMDGFCQLFGVPRWLRQATRLMTGMHITLDDEGVLVIKQVCKLAWLSAVETFPLDGSCSKPQKRRDMRPGKQTGQLLAAHDGSITVSVCWQGRLPGSAVDTLQLQQSAQGPVLVVLHTAQVDGRGKANFKELFRLST